MKNIVGARIRASRLRRGRRVTQDELAARVQALGVDIDQTAISRIESGERQVTDVEILGICQALDVEVGELFVGIHLPSEI